MKHTEAQRLFLSNDTFFNYCDDAVIMLNLRSNQYIAVESADIRELERRVSGWQPRSDKGVPDTQCEKPERERISVIPELLSREFLTYSTARGKPAIPLDTMDPIAIVETIREPPKVSVTVVDCLKMVYSILYVSVSLKLTGMRTVGRFLHRPRRTDKSNAIRTSSELMHALVAFERIRPWLYTARGSCLFDCLVLTVYLQLNSLRASVVLGVKTSPFAAHAWVVFDSMILNEDADVVRRYTPLVAT